MSGKGFRSWPSAWLLFLEFLILLLSLFAHHNMPYKVITWMVGYWYCYWLPKLFVRLLCWVFWDSSFVYAALFFSFFILLGVRHPLILVMSHACEAAAYFSAASGLFHYMFMTCYFNQRWAVCCCGGVYFYSLGVLPFYIASVKFWFRKVFRTQMLQVYKARLIYCF